MNDVCMCVCMYDVCMYVCGNIEQDRHQKKDRKLTSRPSSSVASSPLGSPDIRRRKGPGMYVCTVCMYVDMCCNCTYYMYVCIVCICIIYVFMRVCMCVIMYICFTYVCVYLFIYVLQMYVCMCNIIMNTEIGSGPDLPSSSRKEPPSSGKGRPEEPKKQTTRFQICNTHL